MMARRAVLVGGCFLVSGLVAAVAGPAGAATGKTLKISAQVVYRTAKLPAVNDPRRCIAVAFAQYPVVAGASTYDVLARGALGSSDVSGGGPPYGQDTYTVVSGQRRVTFTAPGGSHWFFLGSFSTGAGCAEAEAGLAGHFTIAHATATVGAVGPIAPKQVPIGKPHKLATPLNGPVLPKTWSGTNELERRGGQVMFYPAGSKQPQNIQLQALVDLSGPVIVKTSANGGVCQINPPPGGSGSPIIIGPGATVRLEQGKPIQLLEWTPGARYSKGGSTYKVRTASMVLSARG